jgi:hypothetical protein
VTLSVIYLRRAEYSVYTQALTCPELPKKRRRPKSSFLPTGSQRVPSAGGFKVSTAPGRRRLPNRADPCANGPRALSIGPGNRSIEEECLVQVLVRDNNLDQALKVLTLASAT